MIILPAQIEGLTSRKDKTIKVTFGTQELSPVDAAQVFQLNQRFCYIAIKEELDNLDSIKTDLDTNKTPSQRLRGILFINYQQNSEGYKDFSTYYIAKMEILCEHYKSKLDK
jgi:hypothetical protein